MATWERQIMLKRQREGIAMDGRWQVVAAGRWIKPASADVVTGS